MIIVHDQVLSTSVLHTDAHNKVCSRTNLGGAAPRRRLREPEPRRVEQKSFSKDRVLPHSTPSHDRSGSPSQQILHNILLLCFVR